MLAGGAALVAALFWAGAAAAAPGPCATVMPLDDVAVGMVGTGWTVVQGTDPESFDVEVLGIGRGLIAPGRDVIIAKITGPVVDAGGGVWAGMSGSPIYIGGELVGALAYGFSFGATNIAGLTPAEDMLRVDGLPVAPRLPARIPLPRSLVRAVAASLGVAVPTVGTSLVRLKTPVSVSGVAPQRFMRVKKILRRQGLSFKLFSGSAAASSLAGSVDDLVPGGNFSAALSYGDVTLAGVGTTTYVCDGKAVAFGHPMLFTGKSALGAGGAEALAIIPDALGPYKLANVTGAVGKLDQDRLAGIRAVDGEPSMIPITTAVTSLDTLASRIGETDVVLKSEFPGLAFTHLFSNIDSVFDETGAGSSTLSWTITGTRADGTPWQLHRSNSYVSDFDLSFESSFELLDELDLISFYPFEKVAFTGVEATANVEDTVRSYELVDVLVCRAGSCQHEDVVFSRPGKTLSLRAVLRPSDGTEDELVNFQLTIPRRARAGGLIAVGGPNGCIGAGEEGACEVKIPGTFPALVKFLRRQQMNNVLTARLRVGPHAMVRDREDFPLDQVVRGSIGIPVFFPGQCCPPDLGDGGPSKG